MQHLGAVMVHRPGLSLRRSPYDSLQIISRLRLAAMRPKPLRKACAEQSVASNRGARQPAGASQDTHSRPPAAGWWNPLRIVPVYTMTGTKMRPAFMMWGLWRILLDIAFWVLRSCSPLLLVGTQQVSFEHGRTESGRFSGGKPSVQPAPLSQRGTSTERQLAVRPGCCQPRTHKCSPRRSPALLP